MALQKSYYYYNCMIITTLYSSSIKDATVYKISDLDGQACSHNPSSYLRLSKSAQTEMYLATLDLLQEASKQEYLYGAKNENRHNVPRFLGSKQMCFQMSPKLSISVIV